MIVSGILKPERKIVTTSPSTGIVEAMQALIDNKISCLLVLGESGELVGIISDKDIFSKIYRHQDDFTKFTVKDVMTTDLIIGVPEDDVNYIAGLMAKNDIRHVPIMENQKLAGLISAGDVVKAQMKHMQIENRYLKMYMDGTHMS